LSLKKRSRNPPIISFFLLEDDPCTFQDNTFTIGKCTAIQKCPSAISGFHKGKKPQTCSFDGNTPIVCCESNKVDQRYSLQREKQIKIESISEKSILISNYEKIKNFNSIAFYLECNEYKYITTKSSFVSFLKFMAPTVKVTENECTNSVSLIVGG
jgi:hypothetical protein